MGTLADSLKPPSAYRVKKDKPDLWPELVDRINGCLFPAALDAIEAELDARPFDMPSGWRGDADELIERRREELRDEDIMEIVRDRFDF